MIPARYIRGIWSVSTSTWICVSDALFPDNEVAVDDFDELTNVMIQRHEDYTTVDIKPVMTRTDVCTDAASAHYNTPGEDGIEEFEYMVAGYEQ